MPHTHGPSSLSRQDQNTQLFAPLGLSRGEVTSFVFAKASCRVNSSCCSGAMVSVVCIYARNSTPREAPPSVSVGRVRKLLLASLHIIMGIVLKNFDEVVAELGKVDSTDESGRTKLFEARDLLGGYLAYFDAKVAQLKERY
jgi:hypothetical protein